MLYFYLKTLRACLTWNLHSSFAFKNQCVFAAILLSPWWENLSEAEAQGDKATHAAGFSMKSEDLG